AIAYQKAVMEFLLINHPLDCPICDQGGECELQDVAMGYGKDVSRYNQGKRSVPDKDIGPLIATDLTRCIHCTRCVRFGTEIAGQREMGMLNRGEHSEIATFLEHNVTHEMSGNVIDLCPVGALTNKVVRFKARPWELVQHASVAPHDCVGSNLYLHERRGQVLRVVPRENETINEVWISDRDRYSVDALYSSSRLETPMIKRKKKWEAVSWEEAFEHITTQLNVLMEKHGDEAVGLLGSPSLTLEEAYLAQKLMRSFGCMNVDHRLKQIDHTHEPCIDTFPGLNCDLGEINDADVVLFFGGNVRKDQPIVHHRIRMASRLDNHIFVINPADFDFKFRHQHKILCDVDALPRAIGNVLAAVLKGAKDTNGVSPELRNLLSTLEPDAQAQEIAEALLKAERPVILAGLIAAEHPEAAILFELLQSLLHLLKAKGGQLTHGANTAGCYLAGLLPHRGPAFESLKNPGKSAAQMLTEGLKAYFLLNVEPELDSLLGEKAYQSLAAAELVVAMTPFASEGLKSYATVMLPIATFAETSGTFVNVSGIWQTFKGAGRAPGESKPLWKVLRVLANFLELAGFEYESSEDVRQELKQALDQGTPSCIPYVWPKSLKTGGQGLVRASFTPLYQSDALVRHSEPLQRTWEARQLPSVMMSAKVAAQLHVQAGDRVQVTQEGVSVDLPVSIGNVADHTVIIPMGHPETITLCDAFGPVDIQKI
ncbi:MAG: NADH-quinone oxidoreductase subunit G, partial [Gammaproteobacteria bacterium]|nr:NADH-quinone oxidoreductase subunit G [Gammaproteobacteria bacterium]